MKKLLFYGGTFDPPHSGHYNLLRQTLRREHFDRIVVMPTALPPHKKAAHYLSDEKRLGAVKMLFGSLPGVTVSDYELQKGGKSYSVDTLHNLQKQYPDFELYMLIGSDMLFTFEQWHEFREILSLCTVLTAARQKGEREQLEAKAAQLTKAYGARVRVLNIPLRVKSSSEVRAGQKDPLLPLEVRYYLYGKEALAELFEYLKGHLTPQKYEHTLRVAEFAGDLAERYHADENTVYLAALLHDATKCWSKKEQLAYLKRKHYKLTAQDRRAPQIFHQFTAALFAAERFCVRDKTILQALSCHTTGRERMTLVDKILFLSDSIELGRDYEGVEQMRAVCRTDLNRAVLMNFDRSITHIVDKGFYLHPQTVAARNWLLRNLYLEGRNSGK